MMHSPRRVNLRGLQLRQTKMPNVHVQGQGLLVDIIGTSAPVVDINLDVGIHLVAGVVLDRGAGLEVGIDLEVIANRDLEVENASLDKGAPLAMKGNAQRDLVSLAAPLNLSQLLIIDNRLAIAQVILLAAADE